MTAGRRCECGNLAEDESDTCEWCYQIADARERQKVPHTWQVGALTGATTCAVCGLLPLDSLDHFSDCVGSG